MKELQYINVAELHPHPKNPRTDLGDLTELRDSIKANGILQNLTVVEREAGGYTVVIGHRRLAAAKLAGLKELPCFVSDMDEKAQIRVMFVENMQRADLTVQEQAEGFQMMLNMGDSVAQIADATGFSETTIRSRLKIAPLVELDREAFRKAEARGGTLRDYARITELEVPENQEEAIEAIGTNNFGYTVEKLLRREMQEKRKAALLEKLSSFAEPITDAFQTGYKRKYINPDSTSDIEIPVDAGEREYRYAASDWGVYLLWKDEPEELEPEEIAEREEQAKEQERAQTLAAKLDEAEKTAQALRKQFVADCSEARCRKEMNALLTALFYAIDYDQTYSMGEAAYLDMEEAGATDEDGNFYADKALKLSAERGGKLLLTAIAYALDSNYPYHLRTEEGIKWRADQDMDTLYWLLEKLGYEMSDTERELQDGAGEIWEDAV